MLYCHENLLERPQDFVVLGDICGITLDQAHQYILFTNKWYMCVE